MANDKKTYETHESYGIMRFSRVHGGKTALFGSSIRQDNKIQCTLSTGGVKRDLHTDWYADEEELFEVEMSQSQFAELITSLNMGVGVPVTIRHIREGGKLHTCQEPPFIAKGEQHQKEFSESMQDAFRETQELIEQVGKLFAEKKNLTKADRQEVINALSRIQNEIGSNMDFAVQQFQEQMDHTVIEAKAEIEAYTQHKMQMLAEKTMQKQIDDKNRDVISQNEQETDNE